MDLSIETKIRNRSLFGLRGGESAPTTDAVVPAWPAADTRRVPQYRQKIPGADFIDERRFEALTVVFNPEFLWNEAAAKYYSAKLKIGIVSQYPGKDKSAKAMGDDSNNPRPCS